MIKKIETTGRDTVGFEAVGKVTAEDYNNVLHPLLDKARAENKKLRFLFFLGPQFEGFTAGAALEDIKLGFQHIRTFDKIAVVSDVNWLRSASHFVGSLIPCPVKTFKNDSLDEAKAWLNVGELAVDHHLDETTGVLKVNITGPLTSGNFEALTERVDSWVEKQGALNAIVIHTKQFPGWEDLGSLISHITFVKNHHRKVRKVAFCADGKIAELGPQVTKHFVEAKIQNFDYDKIDEAMTWAAETE